MSEYNPFDVTETAVNPYAAAPGVSMAEAPRHESGNALAANAEARAIAEVKAQVLMARQFPRDPRAAMENILRECERPTLAERAVYTYPRGKETVSGPSIRLAEMMARNWGNCTFGLEVLDRKPAIGRTPGESVIRAFAWDLETNTYLSRHFTIKHWRSTRTGGYALTDDRDIYELEANMGSRRLRACILQMLPGDVTQIAVDKCRMVSSSELVAAMKDPKRRDAMIAKTLQIFERMGVTRLDLEGYLGAGVNDWTADHARRLKELKNSLDDGAISLSDAFPRLAVLDGNTTITPEQVQALMAAAKASGKQGDFSKWLKEQGIAKVADIPADRFDDATAYIATLTAAKDAAEPPAETAPHHQLSEEAQQVPLPWDEKGDS